MSPDSDILIPTNHTSQHLSRDGDPTHTFGELTVTLQDVACLWGLPIDGIPVTGIFDSDWVDLTVQAFGRPLTGSMWLSKKRTVVGHGVYKQSRYSLGLSCLVE
jgi:hypothetical protein